jgi:uncharacterized protein (DUF1810 family)
MDDPFDLQRFVTAQEGVYERALGELRRGRKTGHWMWFIFPQLRGLGQSQMAWTYGISGIEEARAYLAHPVLGARLRECTEAVLALEGMTAVDVFGYPDDLKFRSSMTLFGQAAGQDDPLFARALEKYSEGERDRRTIDKLDQEF